MAQSNTLRWCAADQDEDGPDPEVVASKAAAWDRIVEAADRPWQTSTGLGVEVRRMVRERQGASG